MNRLYTYIVRKDSGLAPNPFGGWCTLSVCTPNHQGSAVKPGDWVAGFSPKSTGYKFIYAMKVDERIHMNDYFHDPRFQSKKPIESGGRKKRCGDNFYYQDKNNDWHQIPFAFHQGMKEKDTRVPYVFVGREFWYLGKSRVNVPEVFLPMIGGRGARVNHPAGLPQKFMDWVRSEFSQGVADDPLDLEDDGCHSCSPPPSDGSLICATMPNKANSADAKSRAADLQR